MDEILKLVDYIYKTLAYHKGLDYFSFNKHFPENEDDYYEAVIRFSNGLEIIATDKLYMTKTMEIIDTRVHFKSYYNGRCNTSVIDGSIDKWISGLFAVIDYSDKEVFDWVEEIGGFFEGL